MIRYRSWSAVFAVTSLALIVLLLFRMLHRDAPSTPSKSIPPTIRSLSSLAKASPPRLGRLDVYAAISQRPLFSSTRRPVEAPRELTATKPRENLANFVLSGVIIVSPDEKYVLLRESKSPTVQRLAEGQEIGGWRIEKILDDRVILRSGERTAEIELWSDRQPPPPRATPSPQPRNTRKPPSTIKLPTPPHPGSR